LHGRQQRFRRKVVEKGITMRLGYSLAAAAACFMLASCNFKQVLAPDPDAQKVAEAAYADLVLGHTDHLAADWPAEYKTPSQMKMMGILRELIPAGQAKPGAIVGINKNVNTSGHTQVLTYNYDYGAEKVRFTATLQRKNDSEPWKVMGVNIAPAASDGESFDFGHAAAPPPVKPAASKEPGGSKSASDPG
jgi:hypothetical protein